MLESTIRKEMIKELPKKDILLQPIESSRTGVGILDMFYRSEHKDGWIELKCIKDYPKKPQVPIRIPWRPGQMNWIIDYRNLNGSVFLFLHIKNALWVFNGYCIKREYLDFEIIGLCSYKTYWKDVDWGHIYNLLDR